MWVFVSFCFLIYALLSGQVMGTERAAQFWDQRSDQSGARPGHNRKIAVPYQIEKVGQELGPGQGLSPRSAMVKSETVNQDQGQKLNLGQEPVVWDQGELQDCSDNSQKWLLGSYGKCQPIRELWRAVTHAP